MPMIPQALWRSPFRPFFLLGALYGPLLMLGWIPLYTGLLPVSWQSHAVLPVLWHQHEIVFGFSAAILFGFLLTALPSWTKAREISGAGLVLLVLSWVLGRIAIASATVLPLPLVAALDLSFPVLFALLVGRDWFGFRYPVALGLALITLGFTLGNLCYYLGLFRQDPQLWQGGLRMGLYAMIIQCSVTGGVLGPIFTASALPGNGQAATIRGPVSLEWLSALSLLGLAILDLSGASAALTGALALASALIHALRLYRWRSRSITGVPLVWVIHLGYAWLVAALALRALDCFGYNIGSESWVHAFTLGGFGLMSLGFMSRIALRHTGRELVLPNAMVVAYFCMALAALMRVAIAIADWGQEALILTALLWVIPYLIYLALFGAILLSPSLPRKKP